MALAIKDNDADNSNDLNNSKNKNNDDAIMLYRIIVLMKTYIIT